MITRIAQMEQETQECYDTQFQSFFLIHYLIVNYEHLKPEKREQTRAKLVATISNW